MDDNTILELEALKMEARAIEAETDAGPFYIANELRSIASRIRALKTVGKEGDS